MPDPIVRIATYARVSSDEQRDRHTVRNQRSALSRRLGSEPGVCVFRHYEDDGVSGTMSRSKIGRLAVPLRVMRAPVVSPRSGWSAADRLGSRRLRAAPHLEGV